MLFTHPITYPLVLRTHQGWDLVVMYVVMRSYDAPSGRGIIKGNVKIVFSDSI